MGVFIFALIVTGLGAHYALTQRVQISLYAAIVLVLLTLKLAGSLSHRPVTGQAAAQATAGLTSVLVVPAYNEDPAMLRRCLQSIADQTSKPTMVVVVDDGSSDPAGFELAKEMRPLLEAKGIITHVLRQEVNRGKREALAAGFGMLADADLYFCVDSDTLLAPDALEQLRLPFADPAVSGATGLVLAANRSRNLLTRLIDLRYATAFLTERAAYSRLNSVLCCCGSLSAYRGEVVRKYLADFLSQTFLGRPAVFGDDRRLTNYCLLDGRVVLQESATAWTAVPERLGHFLRQQTRWSKSFWRESLWSIINLPARNAGMWLTVLEVTTWLVFTGAVTYAVLVHPFRVGAGVLIGYAVYLSLIAYARSVRYLETPDAPGTSRHGISRWGVFLLAPLYGLLHIALVMPTRFYALATLRRGAWGTRSRVEVSSAPVEVATVPQLGAGGARGALIGPRRAVHDPTVVASEKNV